MDTVRAKRMFDELAGRQVGGWRVNELLGCGKSALVFRADRDGTEAALKVFDPELIERFGKDVQRSRVDRELSLRDHGHDNLVQIIDGGECPETACIYVVMGLLEFPNLAQLIGDLEFPHIRRIVGQVSQAARFLESRGLVHRDIKPENIVVSPDLQRAVLLDLGVIRPTGISTLTDDDKRHFIGTLRYSPPEYLLREEADTEDAWRAVSVYQLGGVLHDLLTGTKLFSQFEEPYARLVNAVQYEVPEIKVANAPEDLVLLAKNCLHKDPSIRLRLVGWDDFVRDAPATPGISMLKDRIRKRRVHLQPQAPEARETERIAAVQRRVLSELLSALQSMVRNECISSALFPPLEIHDLSAPEPCTRCFLLVFPPSLDNGLQTHLCIRFRASLLEVHSRVLVLETCAAISADGPALEGVGDETWHTVFRGVFHEESLERIVSEVLYGYLDLAQTTDGIEQGYTPGEIVQLPFPEVLSRGANDG